MSLDVDLRNGKIQKECMCCGSTYEDDENLYSGNITHNLTEMANKSNLYKALWRPHRLHTDYCNKISDTDDEYQFEVDCQMYAKDVIELLKIGLQDLKDRPDYFKKFNSSNGWGMYEHFVPFVSEYLEACIENPNAMIFISR